jgi:hypothetical protein
MIMRSLCLFSFLILAPAVQAQSLDQAAEQYDDFGPSEAERPLEQLVAPPRATEQPSAYSSVPGTETGQVTAPQIKQPKPEQVSSSEVAPPSGWQTVSFETFQFSVPPDWKKVEEDKRNIGYFGGDMASRTGPGFFLSLDRRAKEKLKDDELIETSKAQFFDGQVFDRIVLAPIAINGKDKTPKAASEQFNVITYISDKPMKEDQYLILSTIAYGSEVSAHDAVFSQILASVKQVKTIAKIETVKTDLDGILSYDLPQGWKLMVQDQGGSLVFHRQMGAGFVSVTLAKDASGNDALLRDVSKDFMSKKVLILDQFATLYEWTTELEIFSNRGAPAGGHHQLYFLNQCARDDRGMTVRISGHEGYGASEEVAEFLGHLKLTLPEQMQLCTADREAGLLPSQRVVEEAAERRKQAANATPAAPAAMPSQGIEHEMQGIRFVVPKGWKAEYDTPTDKSFKSPDGRFTILAFWWFPDEPLLGYDDQIKVDHEFIDREPVLQITSLLAGRYTMQTITERDRADEHRFIFTLEGEGVSQNELKAQYDELLKSLKLRGGF